MPDVDTEIDFDALEKMSESDRTSLAEFLMERRRVVFPEVFDKMLADVEDGTFFKHWDKWMDAKFTFKSFDARTLNDATKKLGERNSLGRNVPWSCYWRLFMKMMTPSVTRFSVENLLKGSEEDWGVPYFDRGLEHCGGIRDATIALQRNQLIKYFKDIREHWPKLRRLTLVYLLTQRKEFSNILNDEQARVLAKALSKLQFLSFHPENLGFTIQGVEHLAKMEHLEELECFGRFGDQTAMMAHLAGRIESLRSIRIFANWDTFYTVYCAAYSNKNINLLGHCCFTMSRLQHEWPAGLRVDTLTFIVDTNSYNLSDFYDFYGGMQMQVVIRERSLDQLKFFKFLRVVCNSTEKLGIHCPSSFDFTLRQILQSCPSLVAFERYNVSTEEDEPQDDEPQFAKDPPTPSKTIQEIGGMELEYVNFGILRLGSDNLSTLHVNKRNRSKLLEALDMNPIYLNKTEALVLDFDQDENENEEAMRETLNVATRLVHRSLRLRKISSRHDLPQAYEWFRTLVKSKLKIDFTLLK